MTFRLLTYNIQRGGAGRADALAHIINGCAPDIVILQEATRPDIVRALAERTGMAGAQSFKGQSLGYLSRVPVAHVQWHRPRLSRHAFIEVVPAGSRMRIFGVHLSAVLAAWTERRRMFELRALLAAIAEHQHGFHVLAGDFNTLAPGEDLDPRRLPPRLRPLVWLSGGRMTWRTIRTIKEAGYVDTFRARHPDDPGMTMPAWDPHVRLDYVFVPAGFGDRVSAVAVVRDAAAAKASDHLPIVADLTIR
ncbi:MAG TPA: endonuclease/exonuclease/phosphatase family protein [Vicinamibacterales bacterium]|nr:endonuclease/exonuclease/phosphatase family protein [Vicinamibacterales bacterium]